MRSQHSARLSICRLQPQVAPSVPPSASAPRTAVPRTSVGHGQVPHERPVMDGRWTGVMAPASHAGKAQLQRTVTVGCKRETA